MPREPETAALEGDARALTVLLESRVAELQGHVAELDTEAKEGRAALARVSVLEALLEAERARVEEWKAVADRNNLASLLQDQGDLAGARPLFERTLAISERALGPDHPDTAGSLNNLAGLLQEQGDLAGARPLFERALAISERALGPDHPDTATSLNNLARLLQV